MMETAAISKGIARSLKSKHVVSLQTGRRVPKAAVHAKAVRIARQLQHNFMKRPTMSGKLNVVAGFAAPLVQKLKAKMRPTDISRFKVMAYKQMRAGGASPEKARFMAAKMQQLFNAQGVKDFAATLKDITLKSTKKGLTKALQGKAVLNSRGQVVSKRDVISASGRHATRA